MKKVLSLLTVIVMLISLCACGAANTPTTQQSLEINLPTTAAPVVTTQPSVTVIPAETTIPAELEIPTTQQAIPPVITVRPTDPEDLISESREDGLLYYPSIMWDAYSVNAKLQLPFALDEACYPGMKITFEISSTVDELLWVFAGEVKPISEIAILENNKTVWRGRMNASEFNLILEHGGVMFIEVVIRADGYIVGYGIFEIAADDQSAALMRCETVIFPLIDWQIQEVSEEYVREKIEECKQFVSAYDREEVRKAVDDYWMSYNQQRGD